MKNRFSAFGKHFNMMLCLLTVCGLTWSCKDEYFIDDEKPSWLNTSVYQYLQDHGHYTNYLKLLSDKAVNPTDSLGNYTVRPLTEVLNRTGSKTVFVATDEAWDAFYKKNATLPESNPWHNATSYANLSTAQKKLLIHCSMLNNAIVMENLASSDGVGTTPPTRGEYMRRFTDVMLTDTVSYVSAEDVPYTYNDNETNYWRRFRADRGGKGIYLVTDSTANMMLHFTAEHMSKQAITDEDFKVFMGRERQTPDVHIYDAKLLYKDSVCENGYVNITEKVLTPLPNMAEMLRIYPETHIFSHMLDRFSYPYYNSTVTQNYKTLHPEFSDSIFTKKYFAQNGPGHRANLYGPDGKKIQDEGGEVALKYDPGWNEYYDESDTRCDMAAMFVPNDKTLFEYFREGGGGWQLILTYASDPMAPVADGDYEALFKKIDESPMSTIQALINVMMFKSFTASVPSKMVQLTNDANEEMFSYEDRDYIDTCILTNNGALYIMNKVYGPADYTSVAAPAYISKSNLVMKWAIYNGRIESQDKMTLNYFAYLKAMKSRFTFFLPSDAALEHYYDPISMTSSKPRVLALAYTGKGDFPIANTLYPYTPSTGEVSSKKYSNETIIESEIINRLKDILESHTIVHDGTNPIDSRNEYFLAKNGSAIKMTRDSEGNIIRVQGGFQLENERKGINLAQGEDGASISPANTHNLENGRTYVLDEAPIIPATTSVYGVLNEDTSMANPFRKFYDLTVPVEEIIMGCGLVDRTLTQEKRTRMIKKYQTFITYGGVDFNVQFFNNYNYTLFVPSNEAMDQAVANGLPTWETLYEEYEALPLYQDVWKYTTSYRYDKNGELVLDKTTGEAIVDTLHYIINNNPNAKNDTVWVSDGNAEDHWFYYTDSLRFQAKITYLNNFIRAHFLDNSVFDDKEDLKETDFISSSYDNELGLFVKAHVSRTGGVMRVRDDHGGSVLTIDGTYKNLMARDVHCEKDGKDASPTGRTTMNGITIQGSSFAVVHLLNGTLNHTELVDGKHVINWDDVNACKRYLRRYSIFNDEKTEQAKARLKKQLQKRF